MKHLYILKIGGSVATFKDQSEFSVRVDLLRNIALTIKKIQEKKDFDLIIIHGSGSAGHHLAKKYNLDFGVAGNEERLRASLLSCVRNQKLNNMIFEIFISCGVKLFPVHTASVIVQKNGKIKCFNVETIKNAFKNGCVPILYGEMVFDNDLDMSICSGDAITPFLAKKFGAQKIFFASDIDGIFNQDPHLYEDAKLIENTTVSEIIINNKIKIGGSHNTDVTGGLFGKIKKLDLSGIKSMETVEIFNGLDEKNYLKVFLNIDFPHTIIKIK